MSIEDNLTKIINSIPKDVKLVAVTKNRSVNEIQRVVDYGVTDLGENRVQEFLEKYPEVKGEVNWHLIGHLQRNKVKYIVDKVHLIHSVDSLRLAKEIDKCAAKHGIISNILIQLNISREDSKYGVYPEDLGLLLSQIQDLENIKVKGLMTMAPLTKNIEETRQIFRKLSIICGKIKTNQSSYSNIEMKYISMGMSNDYQVAIEEGSNLIRVGRAIFI